MISTKPFWTFIKPTVSFQQKSNEEQNRCPILAHWRHTSTEKRTRILCAVLCLFVPFIRSLLTVKIVVFQNVRFDFIYSPSVGSSVLCNFARLPRVSLFCL